MTTPSVADFARLTETHTQALIFRKIYQLCHGRGVARFGPGWTAPTLNRIAEWIGIHKATVSRAIKWLEEQGYILVRRLRWNRSPRVYIRLLIRPRATCRNVSATSTGCTMQRAREDGRKTDMKPPKTERDGARSPEAGKKLGLSGPLEAPSHPPAPLAPPEGRSPLALGAWWSKVLRQNGYGGFSKDVKNLRHVGLVRDRLEDAGMDLRKELEEIIENWATVAPKSAGKHPVPWAVLRALPNYVSWKKQVAMHASAPEPSKAEKASPKKYGVVDPFKPSKLSQLIAKKLGKRE